jgi:hypothetical protein
LRANALQVNDMNEAAGWRDAPGDVTTEADSRHPEETIADCGLRIAAVFSGSLREPPLGNPHPKSAIAALRL